MEKNFSGKTLEEAIEKASTALNMHKDDFTYEIIEYPNKGFLGIGAKPAVILVSIEDEEKKEKKAQVKEQKKTEKADRKEEKPTFEKNKELLLVIENYVRGLLEKIGIEEYSLQVEQTGESRIEVMLTGEELSSVTRRQGELIDSLQLMVSLMMNKKTDKYYKLVLDINEYKKKSVSRLESLAVRTAKQVIKTHKKVTLNSMSAYQRRIVHAKLQGMDNISTYSVGEEPNRRVVIAYQRAAKNNEE